MSIQLERQTGPDCPTCGCNSVELHSAGARFGKPWARFKCAHCEKLFTVGFHPNPSGGMVNGVVYHRVKCPTCDSKNTEITRTASDRIRYHKCRDCGQNFKSVEA